MRIALTNTIASIAVTNDANSGFNINKLLSSTFDNYYVSNGSSTTFGFTLTLSGSTNYVGLAGFDFFTEGATTVKIYNQTASNALLATHTVTSNAVLMITFATVTTGTVLKVEVTKPTSNKLTLCHCAAGLYLDIPRGEQGGFAYEELTRHYKTRSTTNSLSMPTAFIRETFAPRIKLELSNMTLNFALTTWQTWLDFTMSPTGFGWFMQTTNDVFNRALFCFDTTPSTPKGHSSTRALVDINISFMAYNGRVF